MNGSAQTSAPAPTAFGRPGAYAAALTALLLAMNELSMLSASFLDSQGQAWAFGDFAGPQVWSRRDGWNAVLTADQLDPWQRMFWLFIVLDLVFIATYVVALSTRVGGVVRWFVWLLGAADLVETVVTGVLVEQRCPGGCVDRGLIDVAAVATTVKWALVTILGAALLWALGRRFRRVCRVLRAVVIQRYSIVAFLPVALLAVVPGTPVTDAFDQLPDIQRQWLDDATGLRDAAAAGLVHGLLLLPAIFLLGRIRADWASRRAAGNQRWPWFEQNDETGAPRPRIHHLSLWLVGPVLLAGLAVYSELRDSGSVVWSRLFAFIAVPLAVLLLSWLLRTFRPPELGLPRMVPPTYANDVMAVGDIVTVAAASSAGLGTVRALAALAASAFAEGANRDAALPGLLTVAGALVAVLVWPVGERVMRTIDTRAQSTDGVLSWFGRVATPGMNIDGTRDVDGESRRTARTLLLTGAIAGFGAVCLFPRDLAGWVGALALAVAALALLVVMVGVTVTYVQERQPPEVFQLRAGPLGLGTTPVVPLFLLAAVLAGLAGSAGDIHPISHAGTLPSRPTMAEAFRAWLGQHSACTSTVTLDDRQVPVRPMLLVAAEGGGIRAAYWTASALDSIAAAGNGCGRNAALFSGGASGGAFGLTLARFTDQPLESVRSISGSRALGAAAASLFGGDVLAGTTGIRLESGTPHRSTDRAWLDRAGLVETVWEDQLDLPDGELFVPMDKADATAGDGVVTGQLILTSTVVRSACRALVSQVDLGSGRRDCPGGSGPRSFDLFGAYGDCLGDVPVLTAGLLASRFPYVTPSGSAEECGTHPFAQHVDGGYTDNTGLGTIRNLAPQWRPLVQTHNEEVLQSGAGSIVVPVVVYLENGTGADYSVSVERREDDPADDPDDQDPAAFDSTVTPELVVPEVAAYRARDHKISALTSLGKAQGLVTQALCQQKTPGCSTLRAAVAASAPQRVFVVHQSPQPSVSAPLGWVLSQASQKDLDHDLGEQLDRSCAELIIDPGCKAGFANLHDLVALLGG